MPQKNGAFSLIELLVVVSIIGILAAVAVPAYQRYSLSSRVSSVIPIVNQITDAAILQQSTKGRFMNAYDAGLSTTVNSQWSDQARAQALNPYIGGSNLSQLILLLDWSSQDSSFCPGRYGMMRMSLDPARLGLPSNYNFFTIECNYWNYQKVVTKFCFYSYGGSGFVGTDNLIPSWPLSNLTASNIISMRSAMTSYQNMTCP